MTRPNACAALPTHFPPRVLAAVSITWDWTARAALTYNSGEGGGGLSQGGRGGAGHPCIIDEYLVEGRDFCRRSCCVFKSGARPWTQLENTDTFSARVLTRQQFC